MRLKIFLMTFLLWAITTPSAFAAVTIVECVDKSGAVTYMERCPPGTIKRSERALRGILEDEKGPSLAEIAEAHPITLFAVSNCEACELVRNQLQARDIPFNEINVTGNQEHFEQLTTITGGAATVPTLTIDDKVLTGHNSGSLDAALRDAGYP